MPRALPSITTSGRTALSRRELLERAGTGVGALGLAAVMAEAGLLSGAAAGGTAPQRSLIHRPIGALAPKRSHLIPRAKRVIHLLMNGGVSHVDTFDYKPLLKQYAGQRPAAVDLQTDRKTEGLMPSPWKFRQHGRSGRWVSELFPHVAGCVDDLCMIHSMHTDVPEHMAGLLMMTTGALQPNRPSMGAWLAYGLGTENQNLPAFVSICHRGKHRPGEPNWDSSFLPSIYSGTFVDTHSLDPSKVIPHLENPYLSREQQRRQLDLLARMNRLDIERIERDTALEARIESLELAYRMQFEAPEAFDLGRESQAMLDLYGIRDQPTSSRFGGRLFGGFAEGCLLARRLSELARAAGARVAVTGIQRDRDVRLKLAEERGFIPIVVSSENPLHRQLQAGVEDLEGRQFGDPYEAGTVDTFIECSGAPSALAAAGLSVQLEGTICVIATFGAEVPFNATLFTRSGQVMKGLMGSNRADFEIAQTLLQRGVFPVEVYSRQYGFNDVMRAMEDSILAETPKALLAIN